MTRAPQPQFKPAFQVGDLVRVKDGVDDHFKGLRGSIIAASHGDHYCVDFGGNLNRLTFARKELERA